MIKRDALPLLPLYGLCIYFITSIFYVFPSGTPQPADYLLLATIVLTTLFAWRHVPRDRDLRSAAALLIGWIILVNVTWFLITGEYRFLIVITFYAFNMLAFLFVVAAANHDFSRLRTFIWWSVIAVLFIQIVALHLAPLDDRSRPIGTFNNPNQLGYWALLVMACLAVIKHRTPLGIWDLAALGLGLYAVILSASRAASISALLLVGLIIYYCRFAKMARWSVVGLVIVGLIAGGGSIAYLSESPQLSNLLGRFEGRDQVQDLAGRGYEKLFHYPQYLVFGAGEGEKDRFFGADDAREFHSSLGNLLFSYGLVGFGLFCWFMFTILRSAPWPSIAYVVPVMLYGLSHMGLRFSMFWVLLALIYAQARHRLHRSAGSRATKRHGRLKPVGLRWRPKPASASGLSRHPEPAGAKAQARWRHAYQGPDVAAKRHMSTRWTWPGRSRSSRPVSPQRRGPGGRGR